MSEKRDGREVYCKVTDEYGNSVNSDTVTLHLSKLVEERLPTYCKIKVTGKTYVKSLPCSKSTDKNSKTLETAKKDKIYTATALLKNSQGNYWYRVKTSDGKIGYLPSSKVSYQKAVTSDIDISGAKAPSKLTAGNVYSIKGTIDANYSNITKIGAFVYKGTATSGDSVTGGTAKVTELPVSLAEVDSKVEFNKLPKGKYTYVVYAYYTNNYAVNETTCGTKTGRVCLYTKTFTVK